MCGIVGAVAQRNVLSILLEGLRRLEYRGYDSAGAALIDQGQIQRFRALGKVQQLVDKINPQQSGTTGIAHTRWATHGKPSEENAHPHISSNRIAIVHNGIIENYKEIKQELLQQGYVFASETDTEVVAHLIDYYLDNNLYEAVYKAVTRLKGAFALAIIASDHPNELVACRKGSPLIVGVGFEEHFVASDVSAVLPVTSRFMYLEEGDFVWLNGKSCSIFDSEGMEKQPEISTSQLNTESAVKGQFKHYMLKEIFEQATAVEQCLLGRISGSQVLPGIFGARSDELFEQVENIQIIACGTSYHAGYVAKYWIENLLDIPCQVEVASEYRYRKAVVPSNTLFVTLSQSGETMDTLAALRNIDKNRFCGSVSICNVPESSLARESDLILMTNAGPEIGVASTKAFTTQLVAMLLLVLSIGKKRGLAEKVAEQVLEELQQLPKMILQLLELNEAIEKLAEEFIDKEDVLFLGRGEHYPIAMEGALKLKEISYIHAEAYPAGELKHGPLALVDADLPIVVVAPNDELLEKLHFNMQEVKARGGKLYVFAHEGVHIENHPEDIVIQLGCDTQYTTPILSTIPLQLLSYHVAVLRGTDVDQPRNLAKSVTVE